VNNNLEIIKVEKPKKDGKRICQMVMAQHASIRVWSSAYIVIWLIYILFFCFWIWMWFSTCLIICI